MTATDKGTQKKQDIKITGASTLNSDEVDRMVQEAEKYSAEDKTKREAIETKNQVCISASVQLYDSARSNSTCEEVLILYLFVV